MVFTTFTNFDGIAHGPDTPYHGFVRVATPLVEEAAVGFQPRADQYPIRRGITPQPRQIDFDLIKGVTALSDEAWFAQVRELYALRRGVRLLQAVYDGVSVQLPVDVARISTAEGGFSHARGVFSAIDDAWTAVTPPAADTSSPVTPGGTTDSLPVITISVTPNCKRIRTTVTANNPGGFQDYPLLLSPLNVSGQSATTAADYIVFHDGRAIPFFVQGMNTTTAKISVNGACRESESVFFDTFFNGAVINNTITAQQFDPSGLALDHASLTNALFVWRDASGTVGSVTHPSMWEIFKTAQQKPGRWFPARVGAAPGNYEVRELASLGRFQAVSGSSFTGLTNNADALVLFTPVPASASNALSGFSFTSGDGGAIWYLEHGGASFKQATGTGPWSVPGAVMIAIITNDAYQNVVVEQNDADAPPRLALDTAYDPTVSVGAAEDAVALTGTLTNTTTGDVITFQDCYYKAGDIVIDTLGTVGPHTRHYYHAGGETIYAGTPNGGIKFSNDKQWFPLVPNVANEWEWDGTSGVTVSIVAASRYRLG